MHAPKASASAAADGGDDEHPLAALLDLISLVRLSERNFRRATRRVPNPYYGNLFQRLARQRAQFASALQTVMEEVAGSNLRPLKRHASSKIEQTANTHQIFVQCVRYEREMLTLLAACRRGTLPATVAQLLDEHQLHLTADLERLSALRDASR